MRQFGRRHEVDVREVMNGVLYVLETGCQWRALPKDLPPKSTVHDYLMLWDWDGTLERVHHALYLMTRELEGREASSTSSSRPMAPSTTMRWPGGEGPQRAARLLRLPGGAPEAHSHHQSHRKHLLRPCPPSRRWRRRACPWA